MSWRPVIPNHIPYIYHLVPQTCRDVLKASQCFLLSSPMYCLSEEGLLISIYLCRLSVSIFLALLPWLFHSLRSLQMAISFWPMYLSLLLYMSQCWHKCLMAMSFTTNPASSCEVLTSREHFSGLILICTAALVSLSTLSLMCTEMYFSFILYFYRSCWRLQRCSKFLELAAAMAAEGRLCFNWSARKVNCFLFVADAAWSIISSFCSCQFFAYLFKCSSYNWHFKLINCLRYLLELLRSCTNTHIHIWRRVPTWNVSYPCCRRIPKQSVTCCCSTEMLPVPLCVIFTCLCKCICVLNNASW